MKRGEHGFTMVEILVVLGISMFALILALSFSLPNIQKTQVKTTADDLTSLIFATQQQAFSGKGSVSHGIRFSTNSYTIFTGDSFDTAVSKEAVDLPVGTSFTRITLSGGVSDVIFPKGSLKPQAFGEIEVSSSIETYVIQVTSEGLIDSQRSD